MNDALDDIGIGLSQLAPEVIISLGILLLLTLGLFRVIAAVILTICIGIAITSAFVISQNDFSTSTPIFGGMLRVDGLASYLKIVIDISALLTCIISFQKRERISEYCALILSVVLGAHFLLMSHHFLMIFLSVEMISICSYVLALYSFDKKGSEASVKYFLFGAASSAVMLFGSSLLYGLTGELNFSSEVFARLLIEKDSPLVLLGGLMMLAGFLYKMGAAPMHPWTPDVYEGAPVPVIAFLSVAPKLAALGILIKFVLAMNNYGQTVYDWQLIVAVISLLSITIGNFSALKQRSPKRMMAYSSIAQSGFLLIGVAAFNPQGVYFALFYAAIYMMMNFLVFIHIQYFESRGIYTIDGYSGVGASNILASTCLVVGLISLTGLPPTAGFTSKLLVFSSLWQSFSQVGKPVLMVLLVFGLINTVISLFYYLRIPYFAFLKSGESQPNPNFVVSVNVTGLLLVLLLVLLFFSPQMLMGWINKINFVV